MTKTRKTTRKRGRELFARFETILNAVSSLISLFPLRARKAMLVFFRGIKGYKGLGIRYALVKSISRHCGSNVSIQPDVYIFHPENLSIGDNVSIHPMTYVDAIGGVEIGNDVSIAHAVTLISFNHNFDSLEIPIKDQGLVPGPITIESNCWIGAKVSVMPDVTIRQGSIIGAGAVVTKSTQQNSINVGIPCHQIKTRTEKSDEVRSGS